MKSKEETILLLKDKICEICGLPFNNLSYGGYYVCPHCDCGVYRDGTRWAPEEIINDENRKAKAKQIYEKMNDGS